MNPGTVQMCTACPGFQKEALLLQHYVAQRTVNFQAAVIVNRPPLSEPIHKKEVNSNSSGTDHFRQCFLAYLRNYVGITFSDLPFFPKRAGTKVRGNRFPAELLVTSVCLSLVVTIYATNRSENTSSR